MVDVGFGCRGLCQGEDQVLVGPDMFGLNEGFNPKFLKRYAELRKTVVEATQRYVQEVRDGEFPDAAHSHD